MAQIGLHLPPEMKQELLHRSRLGKGNITQQVILALLKAWNWDEEKSKRMLDPEMRDGWKKKNGVDPSPDEVR